jgi:nucleotide-binding universal stress UspA family protein
MLPLRNILCPTDFSEPSYEALRAANELALHFDAHLVVVNVIPTVPLLAAPVDSMGVNLDVTAYVNNMREQTEKTLAEVAHERISDQISVRLVVTYGDPAIEILGTADYESADAIVIATHGHTGWRRFFFGSVAERVVRNSLCPVLTIHQPESERKEPREHELVGHQEARG